MSKYKRVLQNAMSRLERDKRNSNESYKKVMFPATGNDVLKGTGKMIGNIMKGNYPTYGLTAQSGKYQMKPAEGAVQAGSPKVKEREILRKYTGKGGLKEDLKAGIKNIGDHTKKNFKEAYGSNMAQYRKDSGINKNMFPDSIMAGTKGAIYGAMGAGEAIKENFKGNMNKIKSIIKPKTVKEEVLAKAIAKTEGQKLATKAPPAQAPAYGFRKLPKMPVAPVHPLGEPRIPNPMKKPEYLKDVPKKKNI